MISPWLTNGILSPLGSGPPPPTPAPVSATVGGVVKHARVAVRLAGKLYVGSTQSIRNLVEQVAASDAGNLPAQSLRKTKRIARDQAFDLEVRIGDQPFVMPEDANGLVPMVDTAQLAAQLQSAIRKMYADRLVDHMRTVHHEQELMHDEERAAMMLIDQLLGDPGGMELPEHGPVPAVTTDEEDAQELLSRVLK